MNAFLNDINKATETLENQSEVQAGFTREVTPAGMTTARFVGYIELGKREQSPYQGKPKPDAEEVRLIFELNGPKHQNEYEQDGVTKVFTNTISSKITKKMSDKASFHKLFKKMVRGREDITHMAQMLGQAFLITIVHSESEKDGKKVTYANMRDADGSWLIQGPTLDDPMSGETKEVPVPEMTRELQCLLWDSPSKDMWDSIFIDGTYTRKDDKGNETEVSKNWIQNDIVQNAKNYMGSPLEAIVSGLGSLTLEADTPETPEEPEPAQDGAEDPLKKMGF